MIREFKDILRLNKIKGKDIAKSLNLTYGSYRSMTKNKSTTPKWIISFILGYKLGKK